MSIEIITDDGLSLTALLAAAGAVHDLLADRNVELGVIHGAGDDRGNDWTLVAFAKRQGPGDVIGCTVERNPRVIKITRPKP